MDIVSLYRAGKTFEEVKKELKISAKACKYMTGDAAYQTFVDGISEEEVCKTFGLTQDMFNNIKSRCTREKESKKEDGSAKEVRVRKPIGITPQTKISQRDKDILDICNSMRKSILKEAELRIGEKREKGRFINQLTAHERELVDKTKMIRNLVFNDQK
jgi:hypothetical protein